MNNEVLSFLTEQEKRRLKKPPPDPDDENKPKKSQADHLTEIALSAMLFHDQHRDTFARIKLGGHYENWPVRSSTFKRWLTGEYYRISGKAPNTDAVNQALAVSEAKAQFEGQEVSFNIRCAEYCGAIWYDLADANWQAVGISADGWHVLSDPPPLFRRYANTAPQVTPSRPGDIHRLRPFLNVSDGDFELLLVYLVACFVPGIPKVVLPLSGEKGAAKSTALRVLRRIVDPAFEELLVLPNDQRELPLVLAKNYMPAFDNISALAEWQSNMLCCAATGGGIMKRRLYTDDEEMVLSFRRCVLLNGINLVATKPDLLDRSIVFELRRIEENKRRPETEFWQEFERVRPHILAGIFDVLAEAMRLLPGVQLHMVTRMADFCQWGYAIAEALGIGGVEFMMAYRANIKGTNDEVIESNPLPAAVVSFIGKNKDWSGTSAELLKNLNEVAATDRLDMAAKTWPKSPDSLTKKLKHFRSNLIDANIDYEAVRNGHTKKTIFRFIQRDGETPSALSARPATSSVTSLWSAEPQL